METDKSQNLAWYVEPYEGESISHYFGRYRRSEAVCVSSPGSLGKAAGIGSVLARWEKFRLIPFPTQEELEAIGSLIGLDAQRLFQMLPPKGEGMKMEPIRLCAACYSEQPYHRIEWQFQSTAGCEKHKLRLLSRCPNCSQPFAIPAKWEKGECQKCRMPFKSMAKRQKSY